MIATLNVMPEEPAQHMKDYINLHYFFEQARDKQSTGKENDESAEKEKMPDREELRHGDLVTIRNELAILKMEHKKFENFKSAFFGFTKRMNEISSNTLGESSQEDRQSRNTINIRSDSSFLTGSQHQTISSKQARKSAMGANRPDP